MAGGRSTGNEPWNFLVSVASAMLGTKSDVRSERFCASVFPCYADGDGHVSFVVLLLLLLLSLLRSSCHAHLYTREKSISGQHAVLQIVQSAGRRAPFPRDGQKPNKHIHADCRPRSIFSETALSACLVPVFFTRRLGRKRRFPPSWGGG